MIFSAQAVFITEGPLPGQARQRLEVLGKRVRLINSNLWQFEAEFRTSDAIQGSFRGNEDFTGVLPSFTLADAASMCLRAVEDTLAEFTVSGEVRVVSATNEYPIVIVNAKTGEKKEA